MITTLGRVVPAEPDKPVRAGAAENQRFAEDVALSRQPWTRDRAREIAAHFDELAASWEAERGSYRRPPMADALARGRPWPSGLCVEVGAGTGLLTPLLADVWDPVLCVDLSWEMLRRSRHGLRVRADAARLPVPEGVAVAVAVGDAPLFAAEVVRVLARDGVVVWSNALGRGAPLHVPTATLVAAMSAASGGAGPGTPSKARRPGAVGLSSDRPKAARRPQTTQLPTTLDAIVDTAARVDYNWQAAGPCEGGTIMANPVAWFEVLGSDAARLQRFYADLFGWKVDANNPMNYGMTEAQDTGVGGGIGSSEDGSAQLTFYVQVGDLQATLDKATELGGKVVTPPMEVPDGPTIAHFTDPDGNRVGLMKA